MKAMLVPEPTQMFDGMPGLMKLHPPKIVDLDPVDTLSQLVDLTDSRFVDVVTVDVDGVTVDIWLDDEGLLAERALNPHVTELATRHFGQTLRLVGTALIAQSNAAGDTVGLSDKALAVLKRRFVMVP